jgi:hypothetical protein
MLNDLNRCAMLVNLYVWSACNQLACATICSSDTARLGTAVTVFTVLSKKTNTKMTSSCFIVLSIGRGDPFGIASSAPELRDDISRRQSRNRARRKTPRDRSPEE